MAKINVEYFTKYLIYTLTIYIISYLPKYISNISYIYIYISAPNIIMHT